MNQTMLDVARNEPCPCGSGKKYKKCCIDKGFKWVRDETGRISRSLPLTSAQQEDLDVLQRFFLDKQGQRHGPDTKISDAMRRVGFNPAYVYAFEKTGLVVGQDNQHLIPEANLQEFYGAMREWREKHEAPTAS